MSYGTWQPFQPMEAIQSLNPIQQQQQLPSQFSSPSAPPMTAHQAVPQQQKVYPAGSKNVQVPAQQPQASQWPDISDSYELSDWWHIVVGVLVIEVIVLFLVRYFPDIFGKYVNIWYNRFRLSAVIADVGIILIGFALGRYVYTHYLYPRFDWNPAYFTLTTVAIQVVHDILFYFGVIKTVPAGANSMVDIFKGYAEEKGAKIILADSMMVAGSSLVSMFLKGAAPSLVVFVGLLAAYTVPYVLETRNMYSGVA